MKALVFLALACFLTAPAVAADGGPAPCAPDDLPCWWAYVEDHTPLPLCQYQDPEIQFLCNVLGDD